MFLSRCLVALSGLCWLIPCNSAAESNQSPNVVFITIDTLRADHLACYGYRQIRTPNIDALAAGGIRFEHAYTSVPVTLPSHAIIFTGTYPTFSGMHDFAGNKLSDAQPTLASILKEHGYATGAVVASAVLDSRFGLNRGFDFYYDHFDFNRLQESNIDEMERPGNVVANAALDWLSQNYQRKFLLWMHLYDPHYPYQPPAPYDAEYKDHPYDGEIAFADQQVGRLLAFLKEKGLYQNTLIVLSGDHGESLGEHGEKTHGFFVYNSTLHVPLIVHMPGAAKTSTTSELVNLADILPTVLEVLHLQTPTEVQGRSLLPVMQGKEEPVRSQYAETFLPRLHFNWSQLRSVETDTYHYIEAPKPELYDLRSDPGEKNNLYGQKPAVAQELSARLAKLVVDYSAGHELAAKTGLDPVLMERLKSLGYAGFPGGSNSPKGTSLPDPKDRIQIYEIFSDAVSESQHGQYEDSSAKLSEVLKVEPDSIPAHYILGLNYYRMQRFPDAIAHLEKVLQLSPDYALAAYNLGLAYARNGDMDNAVRVLKRTLELDATNFDAAYNLGAAYLRKRMVPEALAAFRQATSLAPERPLPHKALGEVLLYQQQYDEAIVELQKAAELLPRDASLHTDLARAFAAKGMEHQAQEEMRRAEQAQSQ